MLVATHDLEFAVEVCARTIILDEGRVIVDGPTVELLADEQLVQAHGLEKPHCLMPHVEPHHSVG